MHRPVLPVLLASLLLPLNAGCSDDVESEGAGTAETGETGDEPEVEPFDSFPGLSAPVEIIVDKRGIPHIYGASDNDVAYASAYHMASERLFQMALLRRRALGRQAEVLGEDFIDQDVISRTFNLRHWAGLNADRLREEAPDVYNYIISWVAGVNAYIAEVNAGDKPLPYGFAEAGFSPEPWERDDEFAIGKLFYLGNSNSLERDLLATILANNLPEVWAGFELGKPMFPVSIMREDEFPQGLAPNSGPSHLDAARPSRAMDPYSPAAIADSLGRLRRAMGHVHGPGPFGSNNWAIDGRHTDTGRSLIANDPHQPLQSPSLMYAQHLNSVDQGEGTQDVIGFSFAGSMGVQLGHNQKLHWTATTNFADVMDLWDVRVEGEGVWAGETYVDWVVREEVIEVAGAEPTVLELHDVPDYGVIVPEQLIPLPVSAPGRVLMVNWTGFQATNEEQCFARMAQAQDIDSWEAGADFMEVAGFNFVAASAEDISYRVQILVPERDLSTGALPYLVLDGDNPDGYWKGYLPPDKLPRTRAPGRGWIATANNDPWGFTFDGDVTNDPFYYGFFYASGFRAKRLEDEFTRLTDRGAVSEADMRALQLDTHSTLSDVLLPIIAEAVAAVGQDPALAEFEGNADIELLAEALASWDQNMERDSAAALIWHTWLHYMAWEAVEDDLAFLYTLVFAQEPPYIIKIPALAMLGEYSTGNLLQTSREWIALEALRRTAEWLNASYGSADPSGYSWGDMHGTRFANAYGGELDGGWVPTVGGEDTLNVSSSNFYSGPSGAPAERFDSKSGPIFRIVTGFAEDGTPESTVNFPRGNSGKPGDPHWDDTLGDWVEGVYSPLPFRREQVEAAAESSYTLTPS